MKRFDVYLTNLDPAVGREIKKIRPALIVSSDDLNKALDTVIIAPMTKRIKNWPTRVSVNFADKDGQIALDQIKTIDKSRLKKKLGTLQGAVTSNVLKKLIEMFS
jgi:mRNA interferase MazF